MAALLTPGVSAGITLNCFDSTGDHNSTATFAVNVTPAPSALALLRLGGILSTGRRR